MRGLCAMSVVLVVGANAACNDRTLPMPADILGSRIAHHTAESGAPTGDIPFSLDQDVIEALVPMTDGSVGSFAATVESDGTFRIRNVPAEPFVLHFAAADDTVQRYYVTSSRTFDLGSHTLERADVVPASPSTQLQFAAVQGMTPWMVGDQIEYYCPTVGGYDPFAPGLPPGSTAFGLLSAWPFGVIAGSKGDSLRVSQLVQTQSSTGRLIWALDKVAVIPAFEMVDGTTNTVGNGASFAAAPASSLSLDWKLSQFTAFQFGPATPHDLFSYLFIKAAPGGDELPVSGGLPSLVQFSTTAVDDVDLGSVTFANPFAASGYRLEVETQIYDRREYVAPGAMASNYLFSGIECRKAPDTDGAASVVPLVTPPKDPQINRTSATGAPGPITANPNLSWTPPSIGAPSWYTVRVHHLTAASGMTSIEPVAEIFTTDTNVNMPVGVLAAGQAYVFEFEAVVTAGGDLTRPFESRLPRCSASTVSVAVQP